MTVFITGGAGFIGSHTILTLLEQGYDVAVADNFCNSSPESLTRVKRLSGKDFPVYNMDVRDSGKLNDLFDKHDFGCVIHFAGFKSVGESISAPLKYYANNLGSTIALCEVMKNHNVKNIIFSSSATVYNANNKMPLNENSLTGGCTNPYGWTKYMSEQIIRDAAANNNISAVLLRYFNPIGAHSSGEIGEDPIDIPSNLMPCIVQTAMGRKEILNVLGNDYDTPDGTCIRDYIHVTDLAEGHATAIRYLETHTGAEVFNLGTGKGVSVLELISAFEQTNGVIVPKRIVEPRSGDLAICYANIEKAKNILGWTAKKTIAEACADTWLWNIKNRK